MTDDTPFPPPDDEPAPSPSEEKRSRWWSRRVAKLPVWAWVLIAVVGLSMVAVALDPGDDDEAVVDSEAATTEPESDVTEPAATTEPEAEPEVTEPESAATTTTAPTTTLAPTTTTTTTTTSTTTTTTTTTTVPPPPPDPIVYEGSGTTVLQIDKPDGPGSSAAATITHTGSRNFAIWALDAALEQHDLLVNTVGSYNGTVAVDLFGEDETTALEITADGAWTIEVRSLDDLITFDESLEGSGDDVVRYVGDAGVAALTHDGESNFGIWWYPAGGGRPDLLVNDIGQVGADVPLRSAPGVLKITADGNWSIAVS